MIFGKVEVNKVYKLKGDKNYGYVKAVEKIPRDSPKNPAGRHLVKVIHSSNNNFDFGIVRHFSPKDLEET